MPIRVQDNLPARKVLESENIFVMDETRGQSQEIRPLEIVILNLMPLKEDTEIQLMRSLSNTPLQVNITWMTTSTYQGRHTPSSHLDQFYTTIEEVEWKRFDGLIITGAPVEQMEFEEVLYWDEFCRILKWADKNVTSTVFLCWAAQAALYYRYGIEKVALKEKLFGVFPHKVHNHRVPLIRGFDDYFYAPHSRYTGCRTESIRKQEDLMILAESEEAGVFLCMTKDGRRVYVMGHPEYDRLTLDKEYHRDKAKNLPIALPKNYYPDDDPEKRPLLRWRAHANTLYTNWINYYVYQETPYDLGNLAGNYD